VFSPVILVECYYYYYHHAMMSMSLASCRMGLGRKMISLAILPACTNLATIASWNNDISGLLRLPGKGSKASCPPPPSLLCWFRFHRWMAHAMVPGPDGRLNFSLFLLASFCDDLSGSGALCSPVAVGKGRGHSIRIVCLQVAARSLSLFLFRPKGISSGATYFERLNGRL
jgi:hypothetical protein